MYYYLMSLENPSGYSQCYALTLTLKPHNYRFTIEEQYEKLNIEIKKLDKCKLTIVAEITKTYNIHAHGFIKLNSNIKDNKKYIYDTFRKSKVIGFLYIKDVDDHVKWLSYILKEYHQTRNILHCKDPTLIDQLNYIPLDILFQERLTPPSSFGPDQESSMKIKI